MSSKKYLIASFFSICFSICFSQWVDSNIIDSRNNQSYKVRKIGNQWWFLENLNLSNSGNEFLNDDQFNIVLNRDQTFNICESNLISKSYRINRGKHKATIVFENCSDSIKMNYYKTSKNNPIQNLYYANYKYQTYINFNQSYTNFYFGVFSFQGYEFLYRVIGEEYSIVNFGKISTSVISPKLSKELKGFDLNSVKENLEKELKTINPNAGYLYDYPSGKITYVDKYGVLISPSEYLKIGSIGGNPCPKGWHVPNFGEWQTLENELVNSKDSKIDKWLKWTNALNINNFPGSFNFDEQYSEGFDGYAAYLTSTKAFHNGYFTKFFGYKKGNQEVNDIQDWEYYENESYSCRCVDNKSMIESDSLFSNSYKAFQIDSSNFLAAFNLALSYFKFDQLIDAEYYLNKVAIPLLQKFDKNSEEYKGYNLASNVLSFELFLLDDEKYWISDVLKENQELLKLYPDDPHLHYLNAKLLGVRYSNSGKREIYYESGNSLTSALESIKKAIQAEPNNSELLKLGILLADKTKNKELKQQYINNGFNNTKDPDFIVFKSIEYINSRDESNRKNKPNVTPWCDPFGSCYALTIDELKKACNMLKDAKKKGSALDFTRFNTLCGDLQATEMQIKYGSYGMKVGSRGGVYETTPSGGKKYYPSLRIK
jgi:uncharacterized protein (TIGR02145 family)